MIERKSKPCKFCIERDAQIDYKDVKNLQRFVNSYGKIDAKKRSGLCPKHQRKLAIAIKRSRIMALMPFVGK